jgi:hypothetical protein
MYTVNRSVVIIKPKQPFIDWVKSSTGSKKYSLELFSQDCTSILIPEFGDDTEVIDFLKQHYDEIFEQELLGWCTDRSAMPKNRTFDMFLEWFDIESHSEVFDLVDGEIEKEEY